MIDVARVGWIRIANPELTLDQIGDTFNVTRERIRQVLVGLELPTKAKRHIRWVPCPNCGKPIHHRRFCSMECLSAYCLIEVSCEVCGESILRNRKERTYRRDNGYEHTFCSKVCQGKWLGTNYGRGRQKAKKEGKGMTLQDWLRQEYSKWCNEGGPSGWSSGWVKDEIEFGLYRYNPKVSIDSDGQINISLRPIRR